MDFRFPQTFRFVIWLECGKSSGMADLTPKQAAFVEAYLTNGQNGAAAYRAAYTNSKASPEQVAIEAHRLLKNPKIAPIIGNAQELAKKRTENVIDQYAVSQERIVRELALLGFANMADYMQPGHDGDPVLDFSKLTRDQAAALTEVTVEDFKDGRGESARDVRRVKFKLADKRAALVDLGRTLAMFTDNVKQSGEIEVRVVADRTDVDGLIGRITNAP